MSQMYRRTQQIASHLNPTINFMANPTSSQAETPIKVLITGAAGQIGYALLPLVAGGKMFGENQRVILHLLEIEPARKVLDGVVMELVDSAYPLLVDVVPTTDESVAFKDVDVAILVGSFPRKQGMERSELLAKNGSIFEKQGKAIEKLASRNVKVLVVGNPANTNCLICRHFAPSIPDENWSALTRLDQHRASSQIASKLGVPVETVKNVIIWGNHSATQFPDVSHAYLLNDPSRGPFPVNKLLDKKYVQEEFIKTVQQRGATVINQRGNSSALSAAEAITSHMRDWWSGTKPGEFVSMGVISDGSYGQPKGIVFSFPVVIRNGRYHIVQGLHLDDFAKSLLKITADELLLERKIALKE